MVNTQKVNRFFFGLTAFSLVLLAGCNRGTDETAQENITTVIVHLVGPGFDKEFTWNDTDGDGVANTIDTITIPPLTGNIQAHLHVIDRSSTPELDLSKEIEGENTAHLFVYNVSPAGLVTIDSLSKDANNAPFGIESVWQTDQPQKGTVNIRLYHEPTNKNNPADPGGEVDFDVTFPVKVF